MHPSSGHQNNLEPESSSVLHEPPSSNVSCDYFGRICSFSWLDGNKLRIQVLFCFMISNQRWLVINTYVKFARGNHFTRCYVVFLPYLHSAAVLLDIVYEANTVPSQILSFAKVTTTPGSPPEDSIAVFIREAVSMSWPS